ncbi:D-alanine--D-alanine ligase [cyanobiont of Ornithocercus magnificus]|nr:D-alanine--D-alanine ligase [cyanobiont of Ornithocercus magnificus]
MEQYYPNLTVNANTLQQDYHVGSLKACSPLCVGVVFGGKSREHFVSIRSAHTVLNALAYGANAERFSPRCFYIDYNGRWWPDSVARSVLERGLTPKIKDLPQPLSRQGFVELPEGGDEVDVWFPVLHGPNGEDGTIQGLFTLMQRPFVGSDVLGSALSMDKLAMKAVFAVSGLPQLPYIGLDVMEFEDPTRCPVLLNHLEDELGYPCFVKPSNLGSSIGISKVWSRKDLLSGLYSAAALSSRVVVEKGIQARELECAVLGQRSNLQTSVVGEVRFNADWYDYKTKYSEELSQILIPAPITSAVSQQVQAMALKACQAVTVYSVARVDFFYEDQSNSLWINEINTLPGFTARSMYPMLWRASGLETDQLVARLVDTAKESRYSQSLEEVNESFR